MTITMKTDININFWLNKMKYYKFLAPFTLILFFSVVAFGQVNTEKEITVQELKEHIYTLASDEFGGRKPGTEGDLKSANYIYTQLTALNLIPLFNNGLQTFEIVTSISAGKNQLTIDGNSYIQGKDFNPLSFSSNSKVSGKVAFVGYGLTVDDDNIKWNDYNIDVKDKIVVILRGTPAFDSTNKLSEYAGLLKKVYNAKSKGAKGVIIITGAKYEKDDILIPLTYEGNNNDVGIPVINLTRKASAVLFSKIDLTVELLEDLISEQKAVFSTDLDIEVKLSTEIIKNKTNTANVVFMLKGSDPILSDEYIVLGAHFDHLGLGGYGSGSRIPDTSAIHYGADDNASGVASIIEIVEKLADKRENIKRSIIVVAFTGEEMGLLGSKYFVNNPPVDIKNIKFMLNLDMVGRQNSETKGLSIGGVGTEVNITKEIEDIAKTDSLNIKFSPEGYGPSDHASFYSKDISVLFFFSGIHDDYHTPRDVASKINYEGQKQISDFIFKVAEHLANKTERFVFKESGAKEQPETRRSFKVTLGIMPDVSGGDIKGVKADAVIEGRAAYKAGMKKGDIIIALDGNTINDIYEYMNCLQKFKVGQRITIEVLRNNEKILLIAEL